MDCLTVGVLSLAPAKSLKIIMTPIDLSRYTGSHLLSKPQFSPPDPISVIAVPFFNLLYIKHAINEKAHIFSAASNWIFVDLGMVISTARITRRCPYCELRCVANVVDMPCNITMTAPLHGDPELAEIGCFTDV